MTLMTNGILQACLQDTVIFLEKTFKHDILLSPVTQQIAYLQ